MPWYQRILSAVGGLLLIYPGVISDSIGLALVLQLTIRKKAAVQNV